MTAETGSRPQPSAERAPDGSQGAPLSPEVAAIAGAMRTRLQLEAGQVVLAVMDLPRYRHQSLADFSRLLVEPLLRGRVAIAHPSVKAADGTVTVDAQTVAGIAIWATVSDAVDTGIAEQVRAGAFPVRLAPEDWASGDHVWLLDIVAADARQATSVLASFRQLAGGRPVKIHPAVGRLIEPEALDRLRDAKGAGVAATPRAPDHGQRAA